MPTEKKNLKLGDAEDLITSQDLQVILDVNKKAIEINIEVEKQNEQVISMLEHFKEVSETVEEKIELIYESQRTFKEEQKEVKRILEENKKDFEKFEIHIDEVRKFSEETNKVITDNIKADVKEIEKNLFRLIIILGSAGVGTIFTILQTYLQHK